MVSTVSPVRLGSVSAAPGAVTRAKPVAATPKAELDRAMPPTESSMSDGERDSRHPRASVLCPTPEVFQTYAEPGPTLSPKLSPTLSPTGRRTKKEASPTTPTGGRRRSAGAAGPKAPRKPTRVKPAAAAASSAGSGVARDSTVRKRKAVKPDPDRSCSEPGDSFMPAATKQPVATSYPIECGIVRPEHSRMFEYEAVRDRWTSFPTSLFTTAPTRGSSHRASTPAGKTGPAASRRVRPTSQSGAARLPTASLSVTQVSARSVVMKNKWRHTRQYVPSEDGELRRTGELDSLCRQLQSDFFYSVLPLYGLSRQILQSSRVEFFWESPSEPLLVRLFQGPRDDPGAQRLTHTMLLCPMQLQPLTPPSSAPTPTSRLHDELPATDETWTSTSTAGLHGNGEITPRPAASRGDTSPLASVTADPPVAPGACWIPSRTEMWTSEAGDGWVLPHSASEHGTSNSSPRSKSSGASSVLDPWRTSGRPSMESGSTAPVPYHHFGSLATPAANPLPMRHTLD